MLSEVCQLPHWEHFLVIFLVQLVIALVEFVLGKANLTPGVKAGSLLELIFNFIVGIGRRYIQWRNRYGKTF